MKFTMVSDHSAGFSNIKKCPASCNVLYVVVFFGSTLSRKCIGMFNGETASESPQYNCTGTWNCFNAENHRGSKRALKFKKKFKPTYNWNSAIKNNAVWLYNLGPQVKYRVIFLFLIIYFHVLLLILPSENLVSDVTKRDN